MSRLPILINGRWLAANQTGVQRYATEVARRILAADPSARVVVPAGVALPGWLPEQRTVRSRFSGQVFEQVALPRIARGSMLVNLAATAPLVTRRQLVVLHDAIVERFPRSYSRRFVLWYRVMYRTLARRATHLVTVSQFSRAELAEVLGVSPDRFIVAGNGHEHALDAVLGAPALGPGIEQRLTEPFVLCVGSLTPSKNLAPTVTALADAGLRVVVVGTAGVKRVYAEDAGLAREGVWLAGRLDDGELAGVMRRARALVFPSLYEGFGLPVIEAQALGCPVVASERASIPEVAGDGALYFDPLEAGAAARLIETMDDDQRSQLIARGRENAARHRWDDTAAIVLGCLA